MTLRIEGRPPDISVVVPVVERVGDLQKLFEEYSKEIANCGYSAEYIFVIDERQREIIPSLKALQQDSSDEVVLVVLRGFFGESTALTVGFRQARAETVVTLASYFQVEPAGLSGALNLLKQGVDVVIGTRYPRRDSLFNRLQSRVFHWALGALTATRYEDISCGFRVMTRKVGRELNLYGGLHRFLPILAERAGFKVQEIRIQQRSEDLGTRYYGFALYPKRLLDVLTVFFLTKFTRKPLRFFGLIGLVLGGLGIGITGYLGIHRLLGVGAIGDRPLLLLGVLMVVLGCQTLSIGLIGEIIIFTHARKLREYRIVETIGGGRDPQSEPVEPLPGPGDVGLEH